MFYALTQGLLEVEGLEIEHVLEDIEKLNQAAFAGKFEITALSFHAYAYLSDRYSLMPSGASFGDGYGPVLVAREELEADQLAGRQVAIPGELTTAHLALRLWNPEVETFIIPFDQILDAVVAKRVEAGVVIHEGQLTYGDLGLHRVVDLGAWWKQTTGGPLPLGCNGIRKDLPSTLRSRLCRLLSESIEFALEHREEALRYAGRYGRELADDPVRSSRFVDMYVNDWTRGYGETGRRAVQLLLDRGHQAGIIPMAVTAEFVDIGEKGDKGVRA